MPDRESASPAHEPTSVTDPTHRGVDEALAGLDPAMQSFSDRVNSVRRDRPSAARPTAPGARGRDRISPADTGGEFEARMAAAEQEAREYLEQAKGRADDLVNAMVAAIERESTGMRREAEEAIRRRWLEVEAEAGRYIEQARRAAEGMVSERRRRISGLSDLVVARADSLTAGMEDAEQVRRQFDGFIRALADTAAEIAASTPSGREQSMRAGSRSA